MRTPKPSEPDHYQTLGLSPSASAGDVRLAFTALIRRHRERPGETDLAVIDRARQIYTAHRILGDPEKRRAYDESRGILFKRPVEPGARPLVAVTEFSGGSDAELESARGPQITQPRIVVEARHDSESEPVEAEALVDANEAGRAEEEDDRVEAVGPYGPEGMRTLLTAVVLACVAMFAVLMTIVSDPDESPNEAISMASPGAAERAWQPVDRAGPAQDSTLEASASPDAAAEVSADGGTGSLPGAAESLRSDDESDATNDGEAPSQPSPADEGAATPNASPTEPASVPEAVERLATSEDSPSGPPSAAGPVPSTSTGTASEVAQATKEVSTVSPAGAPGASDRTIVTPAKHVSGRLLDGDSPVGGLQGTVAVRFIVERNGRATGCQAIGGSGNAALGSITCQLVESRLRFNPALDAAGRPTPSELRTTYNWMHKPSR